MVVTFPVLKITCKSSIKNKKSFWLLLSKKNDIKSQWLQIKCWSNKLMTEDKKVLLIFFFHLLHYLKCFASFPPQVEIPILVGLTDTSFSLQWFIDGFFSPLFQFIPFCHIWILSKSVKHFRNRYTVFMCSLHILKNNCLITLSIPGFRRYLLYQGGVKSTRWFFEPSGDLNSRPNQSNMVSNDRLGLYLPVETLKPILCCILCPWRGAKVTKSDREKFAFDIDIIEAIDIIEIVEGMEIIIIIIISIDIFFPVTTSLTLFTLVTSLRPMTSLTSLTTLAKLTLWRHR